jgi:DNA-damage-inducible protein J
MASGALVQARVDAAIRDEASLVLERMGLTVSDAVRILLTRVAREGALPPGLTSDPAAHDAWFRARIQEALDDPRPAVAGEAVEAQFAARRSAALAAARPAKARKR